MAIPEQPSHDDAQERRTAELVGGQAAVVNLLTRSRPLAEVLDALVTLVEQSVPGARCVTTTEPESGDVRCSPGQWSPSLTHWLVAVTSPAGSSSGEDVEPVPAASVDSSGTLDAAGVGSVLALVGSSEPECRDGVVVLLPPGRSLRRDERAVLSVAAGLVALATARGRGERRLARQATHDPLTGLPNRMFFQDRLAHALTRGASIGTAVALIDIDRFKGINDGLGTAVGDEVLTSVGAALRAAVRPEDTVARLAADEFAVLVLTPGPADPTLVRKRLQSALAPPLRLTSGAVSITASIGIATGGTAGTKASAVLTAAADALHAARAEGPGRFAVFHPSMRQSSRLQLEAELRGGLENREFRWYYQPVVDLHSGRVAGLEALLRWQHPRRGVLTPADYLEVAQSSGLIVEIGRQMLVEACRQQSAWACSVPGADDINVAVNVSAPELIDPRLVGTVQEALAATGLPAGQLVLEVTETALIADRELAATQLQAVRELGVSLALDDFGTGYSSLSHLQTFPVQILKVDRSFVSGQPLPVEGRGLAFGICQLGCALGLDVVAEGIETQDQARRMRDHGARYGQGYLYSRPLPAAEMEAFLHGAAKDRALQDRLCLQP